MDLRLRQAHLRYELVLLTLVMIFAVGAIARAATDKNLLVNGNLARGSGNSCDEWRTDGWILSPSTTTYSWIPPAASENAEVKIENHDDNDARWSQPLSLGPGWYYISAEARTVDVPTFRTGANLSVLEANISSADVRGTSDWQGLGLYLKIGKHGADIEVALRLGNYGALTRGIAYFRNPRVIKVDQPPPDAHYRYDLEALRKAAAPTPVGARWTLYATFLVLIALAVIGWRWFGDTNPVRETRSKSSRKRQRGNDRI